MNKYKIGSFYGLVQKQPQLLEFGGGVAQSLLIGGRGCHPTPFIGGVGVSPNPTFGVG